MEYVGRVVMETKMVGWSRPDSSCGPYLSLSHRPWRPTQRTENQETPHDRQDDHPDTRCRKVRARTGTNTATSSPAELQVAFQRSFRPEVLLAVLHAVLGVHRDSVWRGGEAGVPQIFCGLYYTREDAYLK